MPVVSGLIMMRESRRFRACPALVWMDRSSRLIMPTPRLIVRVGACALGIGLADGVARQVFISAHGHFLVRFLSPCHADQQRCACRAAGGLRAVAPRQHVSRPVQAHHVHHCGFYCVCAVAFEPGGAVLAWTAYHAYRVQRIQRVRRILLADLTYNFRLSAAATFGIGWGMLTLGSTAGQMLAAPLGSTVPLTPQLASFLAACGTLAVFAVCLFVMKRR